MSSWHRGSPQTTTVVWDYLGADSTDYVEFYELKSDTGWDELIDFLDVFNNNPTGMDDYLNVDNHLWMLAFDNLLVNLDAPINFGHNFYLFQDGAELFNPIIWDMNENFGVFQMLLGGGPPLSTYDMQTLDPLLNLYDSDYPIINKVLSIDKYQKMYIAHMRTIIEEIFQTDWYEIRAHELQAIIDTEYQSDPNTFYTYSQFLQNIDSSVSGAGPGNNVPGITELMDTRYQWLLNQSEFQGDIPVLSSVDISPEVVTPNTTAWFNIDVSDADDVWLSYRTSHDSKFTELEMFDDGNHNDGASGDGTYGVSLLAGYQDIQYYFYAQNSDLGAFLPARAAYEFYELDVTTVTGEIVINEINYNSADDFDPEDWVELYNPGIDDLNISGWVFKDEDDAHSFVIPDGTILAGDEYLVLCNDSALFSSVFPSVTNFIGDLGFGLSGGGELIRLFDAEGTMIDSVEYDDDDPWPLEADGDGPTLELIDPDLDNYLAESWQASAEHGSPGVANQVSSAIITVTSPNGGENWLLDSTHDITWTRSDTSGDVKIELYDNGVFYNTIIASTTDDGTYGWTIPDTYDAGTQYTVKIVDVSASSAYDYSDADFTLSEALPVIDVSVTTLSSTLAPDEIDAAQSFDISNIGDAGSNLTYDITWEYTTVRISSDRPSVNPSLDRGVPHPVYAQIYTYSLYEDWLDLDPITGDCNYGETDVIDVEFNSAELSAGTYTAVISISNNAGVDETIDVTLNVTASRDPYPDLITFNAWILGRESEVLTESFFGCGYWNVEGWLWVECGNFPTEWTNGDVLHIEAYEPATEHTATGEIILNWEAYQYMDDMHLVPSPPDTPLNLIISEDGTNVTLNWDAVTGATSYTVYSDTDAYGGFSNVEQSGITGTTWSELSTGAGDMKFYRVTASN